MKVVKVYGVQCAVRYFLNVKNSNVFDSFGAKIEATMLKTQAVKPNKKPYTHTTRFFKTQTPSLRSCELNTSV